MTIPATGRVVPNGQGQDIVIERTFRAPIEDVWASIVDPERMNRWIGTWSGEAGNGKRVMFTM
ncbi:MAG: ATPase, partial [Chloroflexia bacterium]|nr:ATPase [Chloroflexia bacterium]